MHIKEGLVAVSLATALAGSALAAPYPRATTPHAVDMGATAAAARSETLTVTVALKLRNIEQLESAMNALYTPGSAQYRQFLTTQQFNDRFGPSAATVARLTNHFRAAGLTVTRSSTAHLQVTGTAAAIESEFGVQLHGFQVAQTPTTRAYRFHAPDSAPRLAAEISDSVQSVLGLDTRPRVHPNLHRSAPFRAMRRQPQTPKGSIPNTTNPPGDWTVVDFAEYYQVQPLYAQGVDGHGQTIGIMTFASFTPSDAFGYWHSLGLKIKSNRIKEIQIDGGSGPPSDDSGSDETTLDVEQSGGISPGAKLLVYEAPNTDQGYIDVFARAIDDNNADTLSMSWGGWEYLDLFKTRDPVTGQKTTALLALNDLLIQAALQGQSIFAASGDAGAYDANDSFPAPQFTSVLSIDDPGAQPFMTSAGGTTLPGPQTFGLPDGSSLTVTVANERAWGWDYLLPLCNALGQDPITCQIFPAGGGGGVSALFPVPAYQFGIAGIAATEPGQKLIDTSQTPPQLIQKLTPNFQGRNVPDISVNSDPDTGYIAYYTSDVDGFGIGEFWGGTSFAAPQMNGVTSLIDQALGHRVGLLNFPLYALVRAKRAYSGANPPLRDITHGNNWFYKGAPGYDPATGVGVPNVANLVQAFRRADY
jgi:subtilase family serine protease